MCPRHRRTKLAPLFSTLPESKEPAPFSNSIAKIRRRRCNARLGPPWARCCSRSGYTAIGTVCNLAARLCAEAQDGQILIGQRVAVAVEETITFEEVGALTLKGLTQPVVAYNVPLAPIQPALRVIEGGPQSG